MELRDQVAAELLTQLREARHLSPEQLSRAIFIAGHGYVAGRTLRNIEQHHVVPTLRVRGSIARFFDIDARQIWRHAPTFRDQRKQVIA